MKRIDYHLLTDDNPKLSRSNGIYLGAILHLAPYTASGRNTCPWATPGCAAACLNTAGRGWFQNIQDARIRRTHLFFENRRAFFALLEKDLAKLERQAAAIGARPCARLNGTSDIAWERVAPGLFEQFPRIRFYDYTKGLARLESTLPKNYRLCYSRSELSSESDLRRAETAGAPISAVFDARYFPQVGVKDPLPKEWRGRRLVDGNAPGAEYWFRFRGEFNIGLRALGAGRKDTTGFVLPVLN